MHGHSLGGSRKLNRHWQSGKKGITTTLDENLIYFEREIDVTEWKATESPYFTVDSTSETIELSSHAYYNRKNQKRSLKGFKDFVILKPGNYKVHWNLYTRVIENFIKDGEIWCRLTDQTADNSFGMFGVIMYGGAELTNFFVQAPSYTVNNVFSGEYYVGRAEDYIAHINGGIGDSGQFFFNSTIGQQVSPYRSSTSSWLGGANTFNNTSGQEIPELILHIGGKAPFPQYVISRDDLNRTVFFVVDNRYKSPWIKFAFVENIRTLGVIQWAMFGKIWIERVGDYTQPDRRWLPEILQPVEGYTIIGDGGIL